MVNFNIHYLKTAQGILKIFQVVFLLIAFSCITDCCNGGKPFVSIPESFSNKYLQIWPLAVQNANPQQALDEGDFTSYPMNVSFFLAVTVLGWILVVFYFVLFFLKLNLKFNQIQWEMMVMITSITWSVLLLLCCSLMGSTANTANKGKQKIVAISTGQSSSPVVDALEKWVIMMNTGVVFGFFSLVAFVVDAVLLLKEFWTKRKTNENSTPNGLGVTKVSEDGGSRQHQRQQWYPPGHTLQSLPAQTSQASPGYTTPNLPGQTAPNSSGQAVQMC